MNCYIIDLNELVYLFTGYTILTTLTGLAIGHVIGRFTRKKQKSEKIW